MEIVFAEGGTDRQKALFNRAWHAMRLYPWERIDQVVRIRWVDEPPMPGHTEFACYIPDWAAATPCGMPASGDLFIRNNLDDPQRPGNEGGWPEGHFRGDEFYMETCAHELGHAAAAHFYKNTVSAICEAFGGTEANWRGGEDTLWEDKISEAHAEFFKDVFLPPEYRKFTNRTKWQMKRDNFGQWIKVVSGICPCTGGGAT